jgi:hypothetical protein
MSLSKLLGQTLGLDGAVAYTLMARLLNILSSVGTVLLILRFLSPIEQGFYYTLLSLVALQTIFELGFSFVILQLAAHETARLTLHPDGTIEGDPAAHGRLASVLQLTVRWYLRAAMAMVVLLLPLGMAFFAGEGGASIHVSWLGPWLTAVLAVSLSFLLTPLYSFLEGCNQVRRVAQVRMAQALITLIMSWSAIASGHGLYACALVNLGVIAVGAALLLAHSKLLLGLLHYRAQAHTVSWRHEVWPFQWKIAVSWLCSYFTLQVFTPILFAFRGPLEAGRMGLSLSVVTYLPILALCWIMPKAAPFGRLVMLGRLSELNALFFRALKQSLALVVTIAILCEGAVIFVQRLLPRIAARMESPGVFALLLFTGISSFLVQAMAVYLRSFKREPYLLQSLVIGGLTTAGALVTAARWGSAAIALDYFLVSGLMGPAWALVIFHLSGTRHARQDISVGPEHAV